MVWTGAVPPRSLAIIMGRSWITVLVVVVVAVVAAYRGFAARGERKVYDREESNNEQERETSIPSVRHDGNKPGGVH